jgi:hypothetical protein
LWRRKKPLTLHTSGDEVRVEYWVPATFSEDFYQRACSPETKVSIRVPRNHYTQRQAEFRPPELSADGGTLPAKALLELYEPVSLGEDDGTKGA